MKSYIPRNIAPLLLKAAKEYPVVTINGPRQSGKTTLARNLFPSHLYCNLENPETRLLAENDPKSFFKAFPPPAIYDEVQRVPELLSWIQTHIEEKKVNGSYILTGSHQLELNASVTQSLAGRTAMLTLLPLSIDELKNHKKKISKEELLYNGFLPSVYSEKISAESVYSNYFKTYVERDVRQMLNLKHLKHFENFLLLLAGRIGSQINLSTLSSEVGVSSTTLAEWLSVLEASFIIFRLQPYYSNLGKRVTKSPKLYFTEVGLAARLLGIQSPDQIFRDPLHGALFENMVVLDILKERLNAGIDPNLYYFRDTKGNDVDLLIDQRRTLFPIEIKSSMTWHPDFTKGIKWFQRNASVVGKGTVIYAGDLELPNISDADEKKGEKNMMIQSIAFQRAGKVFANSNL